MKTQVIDNVSRNSLYVFDNTLRDFVHSVNRLNDNLAIIAQKLDTNNQSISYVNRIINDPQTLVSIIAVILVMIGWFVTYTYNGRVQRKRFVLDIHNEARKSLSEALSEYIDWLNRLFQYLGKIESPDHIFPERDEYFQFITSKWASQWIYTIEEYRALFPSIFDNVEHLRYEYHEKIKDFSLILKAYLIHRDESWKDYLIRYSINQMRNVEIQIYNMQNVRLYLHRKSFSEYLKIKKEASEGDFNLIAKIRDGNTIIVVQDKDHNDVVGRPLP